MQLTTKGGYLLGEATSTLIKSLRRGDEELSLFFGLEIEETFPNHLWKRLAIFCTEDIGLADPSAISVITGLWDAYDKIRSHQGKGRTVEQDLAVMGLLHLARAPKNREADTAKNWMLERRAQGFKPPIPDYALDVHTQRGRALGRTEQTWWNDDAWLPTGGYGAYEFYARLKQGGGSLSAER